MSFASRRRLALVIAVALMLAMALPSTGLAKVTPAGTRAAAVYTPDVYENDDTTATAKTAVAASYHTFETSATDPWSTDDVDWVKFQVTTTGTPVAIEAISADAYGLDTTFSVFPGVDASGTLATTTALFNVDDSWDNDSSLFTTLPAGWYYVKVREYGMDPGAYWLHVTQGDARRVYGADRYATNIETSKLLIPGWDATKTIIVASGANYADALTAGSLALQMGMPLILTPPTGLTPALEAEINRLAFNYWGIKVYIIGGTGAVSTAVENKIKAMTYVAGVTRIGGADRFATATKWADETSKVAGDQGNRVFLANGLNFADALAVGPVAGNLKSPILLTQTGSVPSTTVDWMKSNLTTEVVVCGGSSAISTAVLDAIQASVPDTQTFTRLGGIDRYETAYKIARYGVTVGSLDGSAAVLVSGGTVNWPDGLSAINVCYRSQAPILMSQVTTLPAFVETYYKDGDGWAYDGEDDFPNYVVGGPAALNAGPMTAFNDMWKKPF